MRRGVHQTNSAFFVWIVASAVAQLAVGCWLLAIGVNFVCGRRARCGRRRRCTAAMQMSGGSQLVNAVNTLRLLRRWMQMLTFTLDRRWPTRLNNLQMMDG